MITAIRTPSAEGGGRNEARAMTEDRGRGVSQLQPFYDRSKHPTHLALKRGSRTLCGLVAETPTDLASFNDEPCERCATAALTGGERAVTYGGAAVSIARVVARLDR